jgi:hypothetical protein
MKKVLIPVIFLISPAFLHAENIFLKDGHIIICQIISDNNKGVVVRDKNKKVIQIPRDQILRINYTEMDFSKKYIQFRNGKGIAAFLVEEDQTSYVLRKELNSPEEFFVKRADVLFIAERNPSGLNGIPETTSITLSWFPPYDPVKKYNIYIRGKNDAKFELADSTEKLKFRIEKLKSNTTYLIIVKSVDSEDVESSPSNELTITTKNIPPTSPSEATGLTAPSGGYTLEWGASIDPDGTVTGYRVYVISNGKMNLDGETKSTNYSLKNGTEFDSIIIRAVDNNIEESGDSLVNFDQIYTQSFTVQTRFIYPFGSLKKLVKIGAGISVQYSLLNYPTGGFETWADAGCLYFLGKKNINDNGSEMNRLLLVPIELSGGYRFNRFGKFQIEPWVGAGALIGYSKYRAGTSNRKSGTFYDVLCSGGLRTFSLIGRTSYLTVGIEGGLIAETSKKSFFAGVTAGIGNRF